MYIIQEKKQWSIIIILVQNVSLNFGYEILKKKIPHKNVSALLGRAIKCTDCISVEVGWVLWHINPCRIFNAKPIFKQIVLFQTVQFSISTQVNCQKHFYFKLFSLFSLVWAQKFYIKQFV